MDLPDLNELDFNSIGSQPLQIRIALLVVMTLLISASGYYFYIGDQIEQLNTGKSQEEQLKKDFKEKQAKAASLEEYKNQKPELQKKLDSVLGNVPTQAEVGAVLSDVSKTAILSGLSASEIFRPGAVTPVKSLNQLPIQVRFLGSYHNFGKFVGDLGGLPRIVLIKDVSINALGDKKGKLDVAASLIVYYQDKKDTK